jgi:hypothetical protein
MTAFHLTSPALKGTAQHFNAYPCLLEDALKRFGFQGFT